MAEELLGDFNGYLHTDKYGGYNCLEDHIIRCLCWAHGRRKWFEAISPDIRNRDRSGLTIEDLTTAEIGFLYCNKLFEMERKFKDLPPEERKQLRIKEEKPILTSFWAWLEGLDPLGGSKLEKAVNYFKDSREEFENSLLQNVSQKQYAESKSIITYQYKRRCFIAEASPLLLSCL